MKDYLAIYERAGKNWSAYVPDLPGCVAAADTREEVARLIREAIEFHLDGMRAEGLPIPEPTAEAEEVIVLGIEEMEEGKCPACKRAARTSPTTGAATQVGCPDYCGDYCIPVSVELTLTDAKRRELAELLHATRDQGKRDVVAGLQVIPRRTS